MIRNKGAAQTTPTRPIHQPGFRGYVRYSAAIQFRLLTAEAKARRLLDAIKKQIAKYISDLEKGSSVAILRVGVVEFGWQTPTRLHDQSDTEFILQLR
ncbi:hypothetical protein EVAR_9557_1 [Eumeta japonica]|uniref:Uncharacterized protein n=1 Tax=Eumeta variegata TaxID=151549 RepID=A0A4C1U3L7_EUMVA|nr:hypothetical protein EVAR_9557_1 [Eumeta japonica]